ncbi:MAG TPA: transposase, partial [Arcobacter sp.]|nr:transposase [Arcobacter sp.]
MGRSKYKVYEPTHPHFLTCTVLHWLPIFTNQESVKVILNSFMHLQKSDNMNIFSYVILENHLHLVASSDDINKTMQKFKSYTAYELLKLLQ